MVSQLLLLLLLHDLIFSSIYSFAINQPNRKDDGRAAILLEMERLPEQHGVIVQTLAWWKELHRCKFAKFIANSGFIAATFLLSTRWHWHATDKHAKLIRWFSLPAARTSRRCSRRIPRNIPSSSSRTSHSITCKRYSNSCKFLAASLDNNLNVINFRYAGEVNVSQEQLPSFLKTADRLKVKGLAETQSPFNKRDNW